MTEIDPFYDWLEKNPEAGVLHAGKRYAFHAEHGLLAIGDSLEDVWNAMSEKARILDDIILGTFPSDAVWISPWVTEPET